MKKILVGGKVEASAIALGCMRMTNLDDSTCDRVIGTAIDSGITLFDHADVYGNGVAEEKFGRYIKSHPRLRQDILIQSKCAIHDQEYDFSKEHILKSVEGILKRLNTDYIDLLLLHRPDTLMEPTEVAEAFDKLEREGKVKHFGVSNCNLWQIELLKTAVKQPILANQLQLSITEAGMITSGMNVNLKNAESVMHDGGILEYSRIKNITIQAWSPLQYGFFEGVFVGNDKYPKINAVLDKLTDKYGVTTSAIALAWILRHPAKMQTIIGSINADRIKQLALASDITLTHEEWYEIYRAAGHMLP